MRAERRAARWGAPHPNIPGACFFAFASLAFLAFCFAFESTIGAKKSK